METRAFSLAQVLTVTHDRVLCSMTDAQALLNFMTADHLWPHQLPRAARECRPYLLRQFPQLREIDASGVDDSSWGAWLRQQEQRYGTTLEVERIPADDHTHIDPLVELRRLAEEQRKPTV